MKNKKIASVRPSPLASIAGIIVLIIMLIFGFVFFLNIEGDTEGDTIGRAFVFIWMLICIGGIIYYLVNLRSYPGSSSSKIPITSDEVIEIESENDSPPDFERKLRKLEGLKREGLITEEEYRQKREKIMSEKW